MKKIKLAVVGFCYNHPTGRRNIKVFEELSKINNIKIDLITVTHWKDYKDKNLKELENENLKIHFLEPIFFSKISLLFRYCMRGLLKKLKKIDPDVIYIVNEPLAINTFLTTIYSKILNKKIMCFTWDNLFIKKILPIRIYERFVLKNMDKIIAGSRDAKKVLMRKRVPDKKIVVLPQTGIDTSFFRKQERNLTGQLKINKEKTCLFLGRLEEEKGIKYILEAKNLLDKKGIKLTYLFVGNGSLYTKLKRISEKDKQIKLLKWLEYDKLPDVYNCASIFLYPSIPTELWEEQFGYSIVEAMACGLPVIASNMSGPREIIKNKEDGFIIESKNAKELADRIRCLIENKRKLGEFSKKAIKNVKRFDNKEIAEKLFKEIMSLC